MGPPAKAVAGPAAHAAAQGPRAVAAARGRALRSPAIVFARGQDSYRILEHGIDASTRAGPAAKRRRSGDAFGVVVVHAERRHGPPAWHR